MPDVRRDVRVGAGGHAVIVDLHVTSDGRPHIVVDAEAFAVLDALVDEDLAVVHPVGACPCPYGVPPHAAVTLLGFV